jgi:hypothetical protein
MFWHNFRGSLFERAGEGPAAVGLSRDTGAVFDDELPPPGEETPPGPSETTEQRIQALERDLASTKANLEETRRSEQFWAGKARAGGLPLPADVPEDSEDDDTSPQPGVSPFADETADRFLDDVGTHGSEALRKRGFVSKDEVTAIVGDAVKQVREEVKGTLALQSRHQAIDAELAKFPELLADSRALQANPGAKVSQMYELTQAHYRQMITDDPKLKNSAGAMLTAARMAKKEIDLEAKHNNPPPPNTSRRERVAAQMGERDAGVGSGDEVEGDDELSSTAREIVGNLARHLVVKDPKTGKVIRSAEDVYRGQLKNGRN